jgi:hypothetical protein
MVALFILVNAWVQEGKGLFKMHLKLLVSDC